MTKTMSSAFLLFTAAVAVAIVAVGAGADGDIDRDDLKIDFEEIPVGDENDNGYYKVANSGRFPGLRAGDFTLARGKLARGALIKVHFHPRASEVLFVLDGDVRTCQVSVDKKMYCKDLASGEAVVFPRGWIHYSQNIGNKDANVLVVLNSEDAGTTRLPDTLFKLPSEALSAGFGRPIDVINSYRERLPERNPTRFGPGARPAKSLEDAINA